MGKVFSWEQVRTGKIPEIENFHFIINLIKQKLENMPCVIGAAICGSALNGGLNIRSDIDVVLVYSASSQLMVINHLQEINTLAEELFVPIDFILVNNSLAETAMNGINHSFWEHFGYSKELGGIIKEDPQKLICLSDNEIRETLQYISHKRSVLESRWAKAHIEKPERYQFFEKILSAPIHIARRVLCCCDKSLLVMGDSKREVLETYCDYFKGSLCASILETLVMFDGAYTHCLSLQIEEPNESLYREMIHNIEEHIPIVLRFLELNHAQVERYK